MAAKKDALDKLVDDGTETKKSCRRECLRCGYRWLDKYGKPQCPKCLAPMIDKFDPLDTELGQEMERRKIAAQRKAAREVRRNMKELEAMRERGDEKSMSFWRSNTAPDIGGGLSFDERVAMGMAQKAKEFGKAYREKKAILDKCKKDGRSRSAAVWREWKSGLDTSGTERKCMRCFYTWKDKYGKPQCPKCLAKMMDGVTETKDTDFTLKWYHILHRPAVRDDILTCFLF